MKLCAKWIKPDRNFGEICPSYMVEFDCGKPIQSAVLSVTATGVYEAVLNDRRVGEFILAPGWTAYDARLQVQQYDVADLLAAHNRLAVTVGKGWYWSEMPAGEWKERREKLAQYCPGLIAELILTFQDGTTETIGTDESWSCSESAVRFSEIYHGEIYDATFAVRHTEPVQVYDGPSETLIPQQGEEIREQERLTAEKIFVTPEGDTVIDFGQEVTGYVEISVDAKAGEMVSLSFAEVLDKHGNFYQENYRSAKCHYIYTCKDGAQTYKPKMTFYGFRYVRVDRFPGGTACAKAEHFRAIVVHSQLERTGVLRCSDPMLNKLFENIIWGQKDNFLDVPTDCPQRDERLGWTGDAQVFARTACLNFDTEKFFTKWLADMRAEQRENGMIPHVIPDVMRTQNASAAWGDAAAICPWQVYLAYGSVEILRAQFVCMRKWVDFITNATTSEHLWIGGTHFGDWLGLDAQVGSYEGSSRKDFIASAFYAYSTSLVVKAGRVLGEDVSAYEALYARILEAFRRTFPTCQTQTECVLAAYFHLAPDCRKAADQLAAMIKEAGTKLQTGFVGTPYLLHVLSDHGYTELAYDLLLRTEYPSWLYPITKGATTVWEHWDGIMENGDFWSPDMNSFNHYAYGAVADWVYCQAAGIQTVEEYPGYARVRIAPHPDQRLDWLEATLKTRHGTVRSRWEKENGQWKFEITTPVDTTVVLPGETHQVGKGTYRFCCPM